MTALGPPERSKITEEEESSSETSPTISHSGEKCTSLDHTVDAGLSHIESKSSEISEEVNAANRESSFSGLTDFESNIPGING